jgi:hypothetical protein
MTRAVFIRVVLLLVFEVNTDHMGEYVVSSFEPKVYCNDESMHPFQILIFMSMTTHCHSLANQKSTHCHQNPVMCKRLCFLLV